MPRVKIEKIDDHNCLVNDEIIKLSGMGGCRRKGFYHNTIIKFDNNDTQSNENQNTREIELWYSMDKCDRKYFPKLLHYSKKDSYIVQERIRFRPGPKAAKHYDTIFSIIKKYKISDIAFSGDNDNWSVRADVDLPVIFDYGYEYHVP